LEARNPESEASVADKLVNQLLPQTKNFVPLISMSRCAKIRISMLEEPMGMR